MFPISDSIRARRFPFLTLILIFLTAYVFFRQMMAPDQLVFLQENALVPARVDFSQLITLVPFVTAVFLHGGFMHILSNMWFLWVFGDNVEGYLSPFVFLFLYLFAGIAGNVVQYFVMSNSSIPMLGASGAVAGVLGCYYVLFPYSRIRTIIFIFFYASIVEIAAPIMLGYWFVLQLISGAVSLPLTSEQGGIAFWAHVTGFVVGVIFGNLFKGRVSEEILEGEIVG